MNNNDTYEVETRVYFDSDKEAFKLLPFLKGDLKREAIWVTNTYGLDLFKSGSLLRASEVNSNGQMRAYIGYKQPDTGTFCNIRIELDEEITDGLQHSAVLKAINAEDVSIDPGNVDEVLASLGYAKFMTFNGNNLTGYNEEYGVALKLMHCDILEYPIMLEIEKSAGSAEEALKAEEELKELVSRLGLSGRVVRKEPPTLLYEALF